ncbi:MAG: O-antigen ligase family protein [Patescibacteria group bacterium]|nr:O-antigen ligase family protein [Patescibacteria group bacterium]
MKFPLKKSLSWLDNNVLLVLTGFLIAFIPLYPKIPLMDALPGYIVRIRLEDIFVLLAMVIWLIQALRKKIEWQSIIFWLIALYALSGLLSIVSAIFLLKSVPLETLHIGKSVLHYFRYLEYFSLFVLAFSAVKSKKDVQTLVTIFAFTIIAVTVYGYGQKYLYWPVYSTMNREFSKGMRLYLTEHARVQSTFAGHYDLAAFLVIALNLMLAFAYKQTNKLKKIWFHLVHLVGLWLLLVTASRTSFIAYIFGSLIILFLVALEKKDRKSQIKWGLSRFVGFSAVILIMTINFGGDMSERFLHILEGYPQLNDIYHTANRQRKDAWRNTLVFLGIKEYEPQKPKNGMSLAELERQVLTGTDQRPVKDRPNDVYEDIPDKVKVATKAADGSTQYVIQEKERTWSDNALKYGLSVAIRLDTLWPNAIKGFKANPILGKGYATLNKEGPYQFTEAESTDNNFLRILGETGLFGFISFFGIVALAVYYAFKFYQIDRTYTSAISIGFIGASMGLLLNAAYIDVFAASKVAFTYWGITGVVVGLFYLGQNKKVMKKSRLTKLVNCIRSKICHKK